MQHQTVTTFTQFQFLIFIHLGVISFRSIVSTAKQLRTAKLVLYHCHEHDFLLTFHSTTIHSFYLNFLARLLFHSATMATSQTISSHITPTNTPVALLTQQSRRWSSKVLLVEKSHRRKAKLPGKEYQRYIFVDESGTHIQAMSYTPDTPAVDTVLHPFETYIIPNAKILPCNIQYRNVDHPFQWVLTTSTSMEPIMDSPLPHSLAVPPFTAFSQLHQHKSTYTNLSIFIYFNTTHTL